MSISFIESPEPKSTDLPLGCDSKQDIYVEMYGKYETSIITYFIDDVLKDRGFDPEEYAESVKLGLTYDEFADAQKHYLTCLEFLEAKKYGLSSVEFVEHKRQKLMNYLRNI